MHIYKFPSQVTSGQDRSIPRISPHYIGWAHEPTCESTLEPVHVSIRKPTHEAAHESTHELDYEPTCKEVHEFCEMHNYTPKACTHTFCLALSCLGHWYSTCMQQYLALPRPCSLSVPSNLVECVGHCYHTVIFADLAGSSRTIKITSVLGPTGQSSPSPHFGRKKYTGPLHEDDFWNSPKLEMSDYVVPLFIMSVRSCQRQVNDRLWHEEIGVDYCFIIGCTCLREGKVHPKPQQWSILTAVHLHQSDCTS